MGSKVGYVCQSHPLSIAIWNHFGSNRKDNPQRWNYGKNMFICQHSPEFIVVDLFLVLFFRFP
jgi:hypothetical protein